MDEWKAQDDVPGPKRTINTVTEEDEEEEEEVTLSKDSMDQQKCDNRSEDPNTQLQSIERDQTESPMHEPINENYRRKLSSYRIIEKDRTEEPMTKLHSIELEQTESPMHGENYRTEEPKTQLQSIELDQPKSPMYGAITEKDRTDEPKTQLHFIELDQPESAITYGPVVENDRIEKARAELQSIEREQTEPFINGPIIEDDLVIEDLEWPNEEDNVRVLLPKDSCPNRYKKKTYASDDFDIREINRFYDPPGYQPIITLTEGMESVTSSVVDFDNLVCPRGTGVFTPISGSRTDCSRKDDCKITEEHSGKPIVIATYRIH